MICLDRVHKQDKKNSTEMTDILSLSLKPIGTTKEGQQKMDQRKRTPYWLTLGWFQSPNLVSPPLSSFAAMLATLTLYSGVRWSLLLMLASLQMGLAGLCLWIFFPVLLSSLTPS